MNIFALQISCTTMLQTFSTCAKHHQSIKNLKSLAIMTIKNGNVLKHASSKQCVESGWHCNNFISCSHGKLGQ